MSTSFPSSLSLYPVPSFHSLYPLCPHPSFPQPSAAVRGYHTSKPAAMSPSLSSNWVTVSSDGQGAWSGTTTRGSVQHYLAHQQHPHHHHQTTHTSYSYCSAHTPVSTADFFFLILRVILSLLTCLLSSFRIPPHSLCHTSYFHSLSPWCPLVALTITEAVMHTANFLYSSSSAPNSPFSMFSPLIFTFFPTLFPLRPSWSIYHFLLVFLPPTFPHFISCFHPWSPSLFSAT